MTRLALEAVHAGYVPDSDILHDVTVRVDEGELVVLIGPNGAGKSTLIKAAMGAIRVRRGTVRLDGADLTGRPTHRLVRQGVGYVPQNRNVFARLTVRENLVLGSYAALRRAPADLERVLAELPALADRLGQRAGTLSGGERQLLAIARALMASPRVMLLDEPSAGLSPHSQHLVFDRISAIRDSGVAVLMVEQNAHRCLLLCDRAYVLDQGVDAHTGSGEQLLHDPKVIELYLGTLAKRA
jgi:branched-chain amino acid transport system ATP-binding protein